MTDPKDDTERDAGGKESSARVAAQLDALQGRWESVRRNIAELSHAGAEAWRAVEPDARRLMTEMRGILDNASDRFREARGETSGHAEKDARSAPLTPLAPPAPAAAPPPPVPGAPPDSPPRA